MRYSAFLLLLMVQTAFAGGVVGNGGGFALCADQKLYAYDFLLTGDLRNAPDRIGMSVEQHLQTIAKELHRLQDPLAPEFNEYVSTMFTQIAGNKYQWFERSSLQLMLDPGLSAALPAHCQIRLQAAYFFAPFDGVPYSAYTYDPVLVEKVRRQLEGSLQVSYLWVHEWLWNHFPSEQFSKLARFNRLLHSAALTNRTADEYKRLRAELISTR